MGKIFVNQATDEIQIYLYFLAHSLILNRSSELAKTLFPLLKVQIT